MKKSLLINFITLFFIAFTVNAQYTQTATSVSDNFNDTLNYDVWISQEGHSLSIVDNQLLIDVSRKDPAENFLINFGVDGVDISANPVLNFKIKASKAIKLRLSVFAVLTHTINLSIPKSDQLVEYSVDLSGKTGLFDYTRIRSIDVFVSPNTVAWNGEIIIDDFVLGGDAVKHANMGGATSLIYYAGQEKQEILIKDIMNADALNVSGDETYLENITVSPIFESKFTNSAYIRFDIKEGVTGTANLEITATGVDGFDDHTMILPLQIVENMMPTINAHDDVEVKVGQDTMFYLEGITDGDNNLDQELNISVTSSDQLVVADDDIELEYKQGSPYATLKFNALSAGSADIVVEVDDGQSSNNLASIAFTLDAFVNLNLPPTMDEVETQVSFVDGLEKTFMITGLSDGNEEVQNLTFTLTSNDQAVVEDASLSVSDIDLVAGTAVVHYLPLTDGEVDIILILEDDAAMTDNNAKSIERIIHVSALPLYATGHDWSLVNDVSRWGGDSGIEVQETTFGGDDVLEVTCTNKWIWGALNFSFSDTSLNLTDHPYVSLDIYSVDNRTLHWLWFYDDHPDNDHRNDFPDVTHDEGKAVWVEPNTWTTITFDFSGENEMSRRVNDEPIPINSKRIVRILYNYHDVENSWPRPPEYTGTFYIRNMRIGSEAVLPDPNTTIDPVDDQITYENPGEQTITVHGLSDGHGGLPDVAIESLNAGYVDPSIGVVQPDGTLDITFDPGAAVGEAQIVLTVSAMNAVTVTDTFLIKTIAKDAGTAAGITVDLSQRFQTMSGFGTWQNQYFDLYTQELGATAMRVGIISNQIEHINDNNDPYVLNRAGLDYSAFNWDAMRRMKEMGVETFILTSWSAPGWMKDNHDESWTGGAVVKWEDAINRTSPFYYDEWAEYFVAAYRMFEEEAGIQLAGIGIQNEPAFYEPYPSAILSPVEFAKMVAILGKRLEKEGIEDCKLFMPEQVFSQPNYDMFEYITAVKNNPDANMYCDVIATHGYASDGIGSGTPNFAAWTNMFNAANSGAYPKELWMTETHRAYNSYDDAMWIAMAIYGALEYGNIGLWTQWGITGQHIIDGNPTQMLYTMGNFARYIKPGAVRVYSESDTEGLFSSAWIDEEEGRVSIVCINNSDDVISTSILGDDVPDGFEMYLTTQYRGCEYMGTSADSLFVLPSRSVMTLVSTGNKAPTIDMVNDIMVGVDAGVQNVLLSGIDPADDGQLIASITAISSNVTLINNTVIGTLQPDGTATLAFTPEAGQSGVTTITVTVQDDGPEFVSNSTSIQFDVMVYDSYNNPPEIDRIADQYHYEDLTGTQSVSVMAMDGDGGAQTLTGVASTNNSDLIKNLVYNNSTHMVEYTVEPEYFGEATILVTITDDGGTPTNNGNQVATEEFKVIVAAVNDQPEVTPMSTVQVPMNGGQQSIVVEGINMGDIFGPQQTITVSAQADDLTKISSPTVQYFQQSTATIKFTPVTNKTGMVNITVYVSDDGGTINGGVDLNSIVIPVNIVPTDINNPPTMTPIADMDLYLDQGAVNVNLLNVDDGNPDKTQTVSVTASSSATGVVSNPTVFWVPSITTGYIKLTPLSVGTSTITVTLTDNGGTDFGGENTAEYTFVATVYPFTDIDEVDENSFVVYPNPAADEIRLKSAEQYQDYKIIVTDQSGKIVINNTFNSGTGEYVMDVSGLSSGMYILNIQSDEVNYREMIIIK